LMFSGSHIISTRIFKHLPEKEFSGIVDEVYIPLIANRKETIAAVVDESPWVDIGTPQRYISAARGVLDMTLAGDVPVVKDSRIFKDNIVHQTANVIGTATHSSIGARSSVRGEVHDTIIGEDCRITGSAILNKCIVGDDVEIRRPMHLTNAIICRDDAAIP